MSKAGSRGSRSMSRVVSFDAADWEPDTGGTGLRKKVRNEGVSEAASRDDVLAI
jgi:hypothetical protein